MLNAVMLDIAVAAVMALFMFLGWRRGLLRSLTELAAIAVALALAYQAAGFVAGAVVEKGLRPAAHAAVEERVDQLLAETVDATTPRGELERVLEAIPNDFLREKAMGLLDSLDLSTAEQAGWFAREKLVELGCGVVDQALDTVVYSAIHGLVCALAFAVLLAALRLALRALNLTTKLPVIHQLNGLGGLLLGAGKGLVIVCLAVWVLCATGIVTGEMLEKSILASWAARITGSLS